MFKLFGKNHLVTIRHIKFKNLKKTIEIPRKDTLFDFLKDNYTLKNFKLEVAPNLNKLNSVEAVELYNINPYLENININDIIVGSPKEFFKKYDINNYTKDVVPLVDDYDFESDFTIIVPDVTGELNEICPLPDLNEFKVHLQRLIACNINHLYSVNPYALTAKDYLEILNYYGSFENQAGFDTAKDINLYITDGRFLDDFDLKKYVKIASDEEIT